MNLAVNSREAMSLGGTFTLRTANIDVDERLLAEHPARRIGVLRAD